MIKCKQSNQSQLSFDDLLSNKIKFGWAQIQVYIVLCILILSESSVALIIGITIPMIQNEWKTTQQMNSTFGSIIFAGVALGSGIVGQWADRFGRKTPFIIGAVFQSVTSLLSAFSPNFIYLLISRGLFGFCVGLTLPLISSIISEITPSNVRGKYFIYILFFGILGELLTVLFAFLYSNDLVNGNWRAMLLWTSIPGLIGGIASIKYMYESPRYLLLSLNRFEEGIKIIEYMIYTNIGKDIQYNYQEALSTQDKEELRTWSSQEYSRQNANRANITSLFRDRNFNITPKILFIWVSLSIINYGLIVVLPIALVQFNMDNKNNQYLGILSSVLMEIPSYMLCAYIIDRQSIGRIRSLQGSFCCVTLCAIITFFSKGILFLIGAIFIKFFITIAFSVIYPLTAELYETTQRTTGLGLAGAFCRMGGILMPWIVIYLYNYGVTGPFIGFALFAFLSSCSVYLLPDDTTCKQLDQGYDKVVTAEQQKN